MAGVAEILDRAKSAPIYCKANVSGRHWKKFLTFQKDLQTRVPNICHLRISARFDLLQCTLEGLVSPAPSLHCISLCSCRGSRGCDRLAESGNDSSDRPSIPGTLFDGSAPGLSNLELCNCNISWRSPLLKGLKHLTILLPSKHSRPELAVWLSALDEMPQLTTLTLHLASPISPSFPFHVERTVTLPSLTRLSLVASPEDCALALTHLDLLALTSLSLTVKLVYTSDVEKLLPFVIRHAHGPQDTLPLQCVLIRSTWSCADILAWPVPNINAKVTVYDLPTLLPETLPTRVSLSFSGKRYDGLSPEQRLKILDMVLACLPLDSLVMLAAHGLSNDRREHGLKTQHFWQHLSPKWPLLQCVRLSKLCLRNQGEQNNKQSGTSIRHHAQSMQKENPVHIAALYGSSCADRGALSLCTSRTTPRRLDCAPSTAFNTVADTLMPIAEPICTRESSAHSVGHLGDEHRTS